MQVQFERKGAMVTIRLDRPEKLNALNLPMLETLDAGLREVLAAPSDVAAILLEGEGRAFCAGADRSHVAKLSSDSEIRRHAGALARIFLTLSESPVPVVTAVQGYALGAGCGLVSASSIVLASRDARFGYPELGQGILPAIVAPVLVQAIGLRRARPLLFSGRQICAETALKLGLIAEICDGNPRDAARDVATQIAALPTQSVTSIWKLTAESASHPIAEVLGRARDLNIAARTADR